MDQQTNAGEIIGLIQRKWQVQKSGNCPVQAQGNILQTTGKSGQEILEFYTQSEAIKSLMFGSQGNQSYQLYAN